jgi:hypothetical protein
VECGQEQHAGPESAQTETALGAVGEALADRVQSTLMIQKKIVTSGTLWSMARARVRVVIWS